MWSQICRSGMVGKRGVDKKCCLRSGMVGNRGVDKKCCLRSEMVGKRGASRDAAVDNEGSAALLLYIQDFRIYRRQPQYLGFLRVRKGTCIASGFQEFPSPASLPRLPKGIQGDLNTHCQQVPRARHLHARVLHGRELFEKLIVNRCLARSTC